MPDTNAISAVVSEYPELAKQASTSASRSLALAIRRGVDIVLATFLIVAFAAPMFLIAVMIRLDSAGPALFLQKRWGCNRKPFTIFKFRTLSIGESDPSDRYEMVEADTRITKIGGVLRKLSLDELPQLFNVFLGSMSFVGPRPLVEWESREAAVNYGDRFLMKPGITGLTQVSGRNALSATERLELDIQYVHRWSLWLDFTILCRTPFALLDLGAIYPDQETVVK